MMTKRQGYFKGRDMVGSGTNITKYVHLSLCYLPFCFLFVLLKVADGCPAVIGVFEEISYEIFKNHLNLKKSACRNVTMLFNRCEHILLKLNWGTSAPPAEPVFIFLLISYLSYCSEK